MNKPKKPVGRPPVLADGKGGKRRGVYLDDETWRKAMLLGNGKPSEGIRKAVRNLQEKNMGKLFRDDNTSGYTNQQLNELNLEWEQKSENLESGTEEYYAAADAFSDEVAGR